MTDQAAPSRRGRSLRTSMLRAVALLVIGLFAILAIPLHFLFLGSFRKLETRDAELNAERALKALDDDAAELGRIVRDYAVWDDTYDYVQSGSEHYLDDNYADLTFFHNRLNLIAIVDTDKAVRFAKATDLQARSQVAPPPELTAMEAPIDGLLRGSGRENEVEGLVLLRHGPMLIAAHPILKSTGEGAIRGTMLMGRWLDPNEARRLSDAARLTIEVHRIAEGEALPPDLAAALDRVSPWSRTTTAVLNDETVAGYGFVAGLDGRPGVLLRVPLRREIWALGRDATLYLILCLLVIGAAFAGLLAVALDRRVLSRLATLDREVHEIGARGDVSLRVSETGDDELGRLARQINETLASVQRLNRLLVDEQQQSERLLLNVLPKPVAERLKHTDGILAEGFDEASVLFADLVNFTTFSTQVSATVLVGLLDAIFTRFDELADRHGLEKIKTIGDAYMVVAGLPQPRPDHARAAARMALDMRSALADFNAEHGTEFNLRIGIHCGPVVAGVIGRRKFIYDIWGDTVNTASRMESHGLAGAIQVSAAFHAKIAEEFRFEARGVIPVKGKGDLEVYLLHARR